MERVDLDRLVARIAAAGFPVRRDTYWVSCDCPECREGPPAAYIAVEELDRIAVEEAGRVGPFTSYYFRPHGGLPLAEPGSGYRVGRVGTRGTGNGGTVVLLSVPGTKAGRRAARKLAEGVERSIMERVGATRGEARRVRRAFRGLWWGRELLDQDGLVRQLVGLLREPPSQVAVDFARHHYETGRWSGRLINEAADLLGLDLRGMSAPRADVALSAAFRLLEGRS